MKRKLVFSVTLIIGFLTLSVSMFAHHGTGVSYDMHKVIVLKGVVKEFALRNPHSQLYFDVTDDKGEVVHWAAEMRAPANLRSYGHSRQELMTKFAPGATVTITGNPSKAGSPVLVFGKAVTADGWCLCNHEGGIGSDTPGVPGGVRE
jgi:Family of unknown function (DUF6152)